MNSSRRDFMKNVGLGVAGIGLGAPAAAKGLSVQAVKGESEKLLTTDPDRPKPAPVGYDRMPLEWCKNTAKRLREKAAAQGIQVIVLENGWNVIYFTGNFMVTTERPCWAVLPVDSDAIFWWAPCLDIDLVRSWWYTEVDYYFDYPHAEGGFPDQGKVAKGNTVDLFQWFMEGLKKKGFGDKVLGFDSEFLPSKMKKVQNTLPQAKVVDISSICLGMRQIKTPEELSFQQRVCDYFSKVHAFARDYLLQRGTDITDYELGRASDEYAIDLIMKDIKIDGRPHVGVGIDISLGPNVATGISTAYAHPNQFHYSKIKKGDAVDIRGHLVMGGYHAECYRPFQILPWDSYREKVWETVVEGVRIQERESKEGVPACDVAYKIHTYQVAQGFQKLIKHRPGHGKGMEGHQPPHCALGETTILKEGMMFSCEPGLFDVEKGFGYRPSETLLVTKKKGVIMMAVPYTKEWMVLKL